MKLVKRDGFYHVLFKDGKKWRRLSTGVADNQPEKEAEKAGAEKLRKVAIGGANLAPIPARAIGHSYNLAEVLERVYQSRWKRSASDVQLKYVVPRMQKEIGHWLLTEIDYKRLKTYRDDLLTQGVAPATANRRMSLIKTAMREAAREGDITGLPEFPQTLKENNVTERYFSEEAEEVAVLAWFGGKAKAETYDPTATGQWVYMDALVKVLLDVGGRLTETLKLSETDGRIAMFKGMVKDAETREVTRRTKSTKSRRVPLTPRAAEALKVMLAHPLHGTVDVAWVGHRWDQCRYGLKLEEPANAHILRHTFACRLLERGVDLYTVSKLMGHSSIKVTERYAALVKSTIFEQAISKLARGPVGVVPDTHITDSTQLSRIRK